MGWFVPHFEAINSSLRKFQSRSNISLEKSYINSPPLFILHRDLLIGHLSTRWWCFQHVIFLDQASLRPVIANCIVKWNPGSCQDFWCTYAAVSLPIWFVLVWEVGTIWSGQSQPWKWFCSTVKVENPLDFSAKCSKPWKWFCSTQRWFCRGLQALVVHFEIC